MKKGIVGFVAKNLNCQQVKVEPQRHEKLAHIIEFLELKWEINNTNFVTGLSRSRRQQDCIWVISYKTTKSAHFFRVNSTHWTEGNAKLNIQ